MNQLEEQFLDRFLEEFQVRLMPDAARMTRENFCDDCSRRREDCFPCQNAKIMVREYLFFLMGVQARLN